MKQRLPYIAAIVAFLIIGFIGYEVIRCVPKSSKEDIDIDREGVIIVLCLLTGCVGGMVAVLVSRLVRRYTNKNQRE